MVPRRGLILLPRGGAESLAFNQAHGPVRRSTTLRSPRVYRAGDYFRQNSPSEPMDPGPRLGFTASPGLNAGVIDLCSGSAPASPGLRAAVVRRVTVVIIM